MFFYIIYHSLWLLIIMTISYFEIAWLPIPQKRDLRFGHKSTRIIYINNWFYKCEELGWGWDRMILACEIQYLPAPKIEVFEESSVGIISRLIKDAVDNNKVKLSILPQQNAICYIFQYGRQFNLPVICEREWFARCTLWQVLKNQCDKKSHLICL